MRRRLLWRGASLGGRDKGSRGRGIRKGGLRMVSAERVRALQAMKKKRGRGLDLGALGVAVDTCSEVKGASGGLGAQAETRMEEGGAQTPGIEGVAQD